MNFTKTLKALSIFAISFFVLACSKDDPKPAKSRGIKFEVSGSFASTLSATYINASGGGTVESITSLPWNKNITYTPSVPSMAISIGATGGTAGQTVRIKVFAGGTLVSYTPGVADGSGMVVITSPAYIFYVWDCQKT
ncbi:hypothetical protein Q0590_26735 [Rhodocytophaga aerolata]|uniref:Uncharacterized protein n=1 Tax=Rhodocytophaga aerolata TaxID=455078 RepID=A0ABT8RGH6_9BACT|nr:hypothetical protein [Rhodocytophaga aerolata]MDO1449905.1 hypothetical protein [Rhodocytophaga aerolata]